MNEHQAEAHSPTGLERLARLLAVTKENASAEISLLGSQVQALEVERRTLEASLESCRDQLGDANSLVEQLRLENTRKWRVEERDDWRALLDSMQSDRTTLQHENDRLEAELARCIAALLSIFPSASPSSRREASPVGATAEGKVVDGGAEKKVEADDGAPDDRDEHPPELTHRCSSVASSGGSDRRFSSRAIAEVDLEWLGSVAEEFNVVYEGVPDAGDASGDATGSSKGAGGSAAGGGGHRASLSGADVASECLKLRVELDALRHASNTERVALESQVFEQEKELQSLRLELSRAGGKARGRDGVCEEGGDGRAAPEQRGGVSFAGVFRWWRQHDRTQALPDRRRGGRGGGGGTVTGAVTVV